MSKEEVIELLKPFKDYLNNTYVITRSGLKDIIDKIEIQYEIKPKYLTLREYLEKNSCGAYHSFIFDIKYDSQSIKVNVVSTKEFSRYFNESFLDIYYVVKDDKKDNGAGCDQYQCDHYLTLEAIK